MELNIYKSKQRELFSMMDSISKLVVKKVALKPRKRHKGKQALAILPFSVLLQEYLITIP